MWESANEPQKDPMFDEIIGATVLYKLGNATRKGIVARIEHNSVHIRSIYSNHIHIVSPQDLQDFQVLKLTEENKKAYLQKYQPSTNTEHIQNGVVRPNIRHHGPEELVQVKNEVLKDGRVSMFTGEISETARYTENTAQHSQVDVSISDKTGQNKARGSKRHQTESTQLDDIHSTQEGIEIGVSDQNNCNRLEAESNYDITKNNGDFTSSNSKKSTLARTRNKNTREDVIIDEKAPRNRTTIARKSLTLTQQKIVDKHRGTPRKANSKPKDTESRKLAELMKEATNSQESSHREVTSRRNNIRLTASAGLNEDLKEVKKTKKVTKPEKAPIIDTQPLRSDSHDPFPDNVPPVISSRAKISPRVGLSRPKSRKLGPNRTKGDTEGIDPSNIYQIEDGSADLQNPKKLNNRLGRNAPLTKQFQHNPGTPESKVSSKKVGRKTENRTRHRHISDVVNLNLNKDALDDRDEGVIKRPGRPKKSSRSDEDPQTTKRKTANGQNKNDEQPRRVSDSQDNRGGSSKDTVQLDIINPYGTQPVNKSVKKRLSHIGAIARNPIPEPLTLLSEVQLPENGKTLNNPKMRTKNLVRGRTDTLNAPGVTGISVDERYPISELKTGPSKFKTPRLETAGNTESQVSTQASTKAKWNIDTKPGNTNISRSETVLNREIKDSDKEPVTANRAKDAKSGNVKISRSETAANSELEVVSQTPAPLGRAKDAKTLCSKPSRLETIVSSESQVYAHAPPTTKRDSDAEPSSATSKNRPQNKKSVVLRKSLASTRPRPAKTNPSPLVKRKHSAQDRTVRSRSRLKDLRGSDFYYQKESLSNKKRRLSDNVRTNMNLSEFVHKNPSFHEEEPGCAKNLFKPESSNGSSEEVTLPQRKGVVTLARGAEHTNEIHENSLTRTRFEDTRNSASSVRSLRNKVIDDISVSHNTVKPDLDRYPKQQNKTERKYRYSNRPPQESVETFVLDMAKEIPEGYGKQQSTTLPCDQRIGGSQSILADTNLGIRDSGYSKRLKKSVFPNDADSPSKSSELPENDVGYNGDENHIEKLHKQSIKSQDPTNQLNNENKQCEDEFQHKNTKAFKLRGHGAKSRFYSEKRHASKPDFGHAVMPIHVDRITTSSITKQYTDYLNSVRQKQQQMTDNSYLMGSNTQKINYQKLEEMTPKTTHNYMMRFPISFQDHSQEISALRYRNQASEELLRSLKSLIIPVCGHGSLDEHLTCFKAHLKRNIEMFYLLLCISCQYFGSEEDQIVAIAAENTLKHFKPLKQYKIGFVIAKNNIFTKIGLFLAKRMSATHNIQVFPQEKFHQSAHKYVGMCELENVKFSADVHNDCDILVSFNTNRDFRDVRKKIYLGDLDYSSIDPKSSVLCYGYKYDELSKHKGKVYVVDVGFSNIFYEKLGLDRGL